MRLVFRLEDPPAGHPGGRPSTVVQPIVNQLREHPGQWARVAEFPAQRPAGSLASRLAIHPNIQAMSRQVDGKAVVWARWTP
jgi:hypothetical protein